VNFDAFFAIQNPASESMFLREPIDERAKSDALNDTANSD
jgi:hypothetical protein